MRLAAWLRPDPLGSLSASPDPLSAMGGGPTSKEKGEKKRRGEG